MHKQYGFTLVELAIVLMIVGLLIGGVLRGQEMVHTARLNTIIKQTQSYAGAIATFQDGYSGLPGDISLATQRIPGCSTSIGCVDGNANGIIGVPTFYYNIGDQAPGSENAQFWRHLALGRLISGIRPDNGATNAEWGKTHPVAQGTGGGFSVITSLTSGAGGYPTGTRGLRLHGSLTNGNIEVEASISPKDASFIDRKMDDGIPSSGTVRSKGYGSGAEVDNCEISYTNEEHKSCTMSFLLS